MLNTVFSVFQIIFDILVIVYILKARREREK